MFIVEYDSAFAFGVMLFELPSEENDFARYVEAIPKLDSRAAGRDAPVLVVEFAEGYPAPSAVWRKRFVEARVKLASSPLVALVAPSVAMRAGIALARWIRPPQFEQRVFSTFDEAMEWTEEKRGGTTKILHRLYLEAKQRAGRP